jgi:hypothetical protein
LEEVYSSPSLVVDPLVLIVRFLVELFCFLARDGLLLDDVLIPGRIGGPFHLGRVGCLLDAFDWFRILGGDGRFVLLDFRAC